MEQLRRRQNNPVFQEYSFNFIGVSRKFFNCFNPLWRSSNDICRLGSGRSNTTMTVFTPINFSEKILYQHLIVRTPDKFSFNYNFYHYFFSRVIAQKAMNYLVPMESD